MKLNEENKKELEKIEAELEAEGGGMAFAGAILYLVMTAIKSKTYKVWNNPDEEIIEYDIIVDFTIAGDPLFGLYQRGTSDQHLLLESTEEGIKTYALI